MLLVRHYPAFLVIALVGAIPACAPERNCVPEHLAKSATLTDCCLPMGSHAPVDPDAIRRVSDEFRNRGVSQHPPGTRPYNFLAISGGGLYGAFGAGVLFGWEENGTRPQFDAVTGISIGSLMATFAFLGPQYDHVLRKNTSGIALDDLVRRRSILTIPFTDAIFSSDRLSKKIDEAFPDSVLCDVAKAHATGRRLYVGTTNLDARKLVIWDMGAIASRGTPEAYALYRKVSLASCSVPGAFPPVHISVQIDGKTYEELHGDGGASEEVIFRPFMVTDLNRAAGRPGMIAPPGSTLFMIGNGKLYADPECVSPRIFPQVKAGVRSIIYAKGRDEFYRIYLNCLETGVDFRLTAVPDSVPLGRSSLQLSAEDQIRLVSEGRKIGLTAPFGPGWLDVPPGADPTGHALPRAGTCFTSTPVPDVVYPGP